jgi:hypothetical protein
MAAVRFLNNTRRFLLKVMGALELDNYHVLGNDRNRPAQSLLPILTGHTLRALQSKYGSRIDDLPWLWREFHEGGYVTAFAEEKVYNFTRQPTDYCYQPFVQAMAAPIEQSPCVGKRLSHVVMLDWLRQLMRQYTPHSKFFFAVLSKGTRPDAKGVHTLDDDLRAFLAAIKTDGHLVNTMVVVTSDSGQPVLWSPGVPPQAVLEERLPYLAITLPNLFKLVHSDMVVNLVQNVQRLTTPLDLHRTLQHVLYFPKAPPATNQHAVSLFQEISKNRTCRSVGILSKWCACP